LSENITNQLQGIVTQHYRREPGTMSVLR